MTVRAGREFLAIPGPTVIPDEVLRAMHRPAIDIYSGELLGITDSLMRDLPTLFKTKGRAYVYISNGHGAWEGALTNVLSKGDKVLVLESGRFAAGWGEFAARLGVEVETLKGELAARGAARRGRGAAEEGHQGRDQGDPGDAGRYGFGCRQRHRSDRQGDQGRQPQRAVHGRRGRLARLRAVRHGRLGRRRCGLRIAEGPDDAAGPRLRRGQRPRPRGEQERRACARPIGTGARATARCTTTNMRAPLQCI